MSRNGRKRSSIADKIIIEYNQKKRFEHFIKTKKNRELKDKIENESSNK